MRSFFYGKLINTKYDGFESHISLIRLSFFRNLTRFLRFSNAPVRENEAENEGENDRMYANHFCFLHYITTYACQRVASIDLVPQKDPGEGQRCVLSREKIEQKS